MPSYDNYLSKIHELKNPEDLEYLGKLFPDHYDHPDYAGGGREPRPPLIDNPNFLTTMNGFSPFHYEATILLGMSACDAVIKNGENLTLMGQDHFDAILHTTFTGVSGDIVLDNSTGTRTADSSLFRIVNYLEEEGITEDGTPVVQFKPIISGLFQDNEWNQLEAYVFNDGTTNIPPDLPPPPTSDSGLDLGLAIGLSVASAVVLALIFYFYQDNKRRANDSVWHVKKEELKFGDPPEVIGRGTFGLVLMAEYRGTQVAIKQVIPPSKNLKRARRTNYLDFSSRSGGDTSEGADSSNSPVPIGNAGMTSGYGLASSCGNTTEVTKSAANGGTASWAGMSLGEMMGSMVGSRKNHQGKATLKQTRQSQQSTNRRKLETEFIEEMRYLSKLRHPCITTVMGKQIWMHLLSQSIQYLISLFCIFVYFRCCHWSWRRAYACNGGM